MAGVMPNLKLFIYVILLSMTIIILLSLAELVHNLLKLNRKKRPASTTLANFSTFFYASFLKPHNGDGALNGQQAALESFYKAQVRRFVAGIIALTAVLLPPFIFKQKLPARRRTSLYSLI